jgi:uncharacterized Zn finger protein
MSKPPLNLRQIRALAGDLWFARGEAYYLQGRVAELSEHNGKFSAIVTGTEDYRVRLWTENSDLGYSCTCPLGDDEQFCKHCVAAALAWLATEQNEGDAPQRTRESRENDLRTFLEQQEKENLVTMLLREAENNRGARERLHLEAARKKPSGVDLGAFRRSIANATRTGGFVDYYAAPRYARRVHQVIDSISLLLDDGHAKAVVALAEYTLTKLEKAIGEMDDSDGHMGDILPDLYELHHRACEQAGEDPKTLAQRLFRWELKSDWDFFRDTAEMYADVLGPQGLAEYSRLAEAEWKKLPALVPGDDDNERFGERFRITSIMESLARQSGDHEALVAVKRHDLAHPYSFLQIAEIYQQAGKHDQALEWAEKGMRAFSRTDSRLSDFLADEYHRRGRHAEAMDLIWAQFTEAPQLVTYQKLQAHATMSDKLQVSDAMSDKLQFVADLETKDRSEAVARRAKKVLNSKLGIRNSKLPSADRQTEVCRTSTSTSEWSSWREKALAHLRAITKTEMRSEQHAKPAYSWQISPDHSRLVEIFLWEKNHEEAWQEATAGGCTGYLWLQLADASAKDHPERALPIYKELIAPTLAQTNNVAYDEAIELLRKMRKAMASLNREAEFDDYLVALRVEYKRKRNFIKLLDGLRK